MDAVGAPHAGRHFIGLGLTLEDGQQRVHIGDDQIHGVLQHAGQGGVHHVGAGKAEMQVAAFLAQGFGDAAGEGYYVMVRGFLNFSDALHGKGCLLRHSVGRLLGNLAQLGPGLGRGQLHLQPTLEFCLHGPKAGHGLAGITIDHRMMPPE